MAFGVMRNSSPESQIEELVAKYSPEVAAQLREARAKLWALFPRGFELVFDNYNAVDFAISPTEKAAEAFISVAGYPRGSRCSSSTEQNGAIRKTYSKAAEGRF